MAKHEKQGEEDVPCIYCSELYLESRRVGVWIKCQTCKKWAHEDCVGQTVRDDNYIIFMWILQRIESESLRLWTLRCYLKAYIIRRYMRCSQGPGKIIFRSIHLNETFSSNNFICVICECYSRDNIYISLNTLHFLTAFRHTHVLVHFAPGSLM